MKNENETKHTKNDMKGNMIYAIWLMQTKQQDKRKTIYAMWLMQTKQRKGDKAHEGRYGKGK